MAKLRRLPSQGIIDGFKGTIDFYVHDGVPCARSWPRSPGKRRAPAVEAQWPVFSYATKIWPYLSDEVRQSYILAAKGTNLTGRDLAIKAYMKGYLKQ